MQQISTMVGNLRNMAQDMGTEVENQNRQLDRINLKVRCMCKLTSNNLKKCGVFFSGFFQRISSENGQWQGWKIIKVTA